MKQTVVNPSGIVTKPNELGSLPPGTLSVGNGIQIRRQSIIEPRNAFKHLGDLHEIFRRGVKLWPRTFASLTLPATYSSELANTLVVAEDPDTGVMHLFNHAFGGATTEIFRYPGNTSFSFSRNKAHFSSNRNRTIIVSNDPPAILDPTATKARPAGLVAPFLVEIKAGNFGIETNWTKDWFIAYAGVLRWKDGSYVIRGPVSNKLGAKNTSGGNVYPVVTFTWPADIYVPSNAVFELYRVPQQETAALLGDDYRKVGEYRLIDFGFINPNYITIEDRTPDGSLSDYLYTNLAQDGAGKTNEAPPQSRDVFTYKNVTFYVATATTQQLTVQTPFKWGKLITEDELLFGLGSREYTGDLTAGSAEVTGMAFPVGVHVGQIMHGAGGGPHEVTGVSGVGVTLDHPVTNNANDAVLTFVDRIFIDEVGIEAPSAGEFQRRLGQLLDNGTLKTGVTYSETPVYDSTAPTEAVMLTFRQFNASAGPFTIKATNGPNFSPALPDGHPDTTPRSSTSDVRADRLLYSKIEQPEAVPPSNYIFVGHGAIIKLWATQDSLFVFCTDGIYRINGDGDDWKLEPVDPDTVLLSADAVGSMDGVIFAFTNVGLIALSDSGGIQKITAQIFNDDYTRLWLGEGLEKAYAAIACDKPNHEVWVNFRYEDQYVATYIWNDVTRTLVTQSEEPAEAFAYSPVLQSMISAAGNELHQVDSFDWMGTDVEFNSVYADDAGVLKQWIDVTLFFETLTENAAFMPRFNSEQYLDYYEIGANTAPFDHVVAPVLNATHHKHNRFGFWLARWSEGGTKPYYQLKGLTYRFRVAAEPLTR